MTGRERATPYVGRLNGHRALMPGEIAALVRARQHGVGATELARRFDISRRTVYRWAHARLVEVEVDGWHATFAVRPEDSRVREGPVQVTEWMR